MSGIRIHKWNDEDTIISLYFTIYGIKGLPVQDDIDLAEGIIGTTIASLHMQCANIRCVLGEDTGILTDFSRLQENIVNEYRKTTFDELKTIVLDIIESRDIDFNRQRVLEIKNSREQKLIAKLKQKELDEIFRKMGKDPRKMRKVVK